MIYEINEINKGKTIKDFLRNKDISSGLLKKLKKIPMGITVNGNHENVNYVLEAGDRLEIMVKDFEEDTNEYLLPVDLPIEIVYEDENITVVNKPSGMPTHQSLNNHNNTLANALRFRYINKPYVFRASNRLDKDTSGIVITANNRYYASLVSEKIKNGSVTKEYIAVVLGRLEGSGTIDAPIDRIGESIIKREVREDGERAITDYRAVFSSDEISVVSVLPKTGRTHQIRVHLSHIGHSIVGDALYGGKSELMNRQALHCLKMDIEGIGSFYAPLADDIKSLIRRFFNDKENL